MLILSNKMNKDISTYKYTIEPKRGLLLYLDAHERSTLRFPVLLCLLDPLYSFHLKSFLPVLLAAVNILKLQG